MITTTFLTNFLLGFILAAEFGQVSIEIFRRGIQYGFKQAILTSLGGTFADLIYLSIAITGIILVLDRPDILRFLWVIGGMAMLYIGVSGVRSSLKEKEIVSQYPNTNSFMTGFLLNFAHPLNLIWWITLLSPILVKDMQKTSMATAYINGTGIVFGVFAWWLILSVLTVLARKQLTVRKLQYISAASSVILVGFSAWFFYQAFVI